MAETGRRVKRAKKSHELESASSPFDTLPDEMVVSVFQHLDSLTRHNIASVCRRWKSVLSEPSLNDKVISIDLSTIPTKSAPASRNELRKFDFWDDCVLLDTLGFLLEKHPAAETLLIYDSARQHQYGGNAVTPVQCGHIRETCSTNCAGWLGHDVRALMRELHNLLSYGRPERRNIRRRFVKTFVLDKITAQARDLFWLLHDEQQAYPAKMFGCIVLRDVEIAGLSIPSLNTYFMCSPEESTGLRRTVSCRIPVLAASTVTSALFEALSLQEASLTAGEEELFFRAVATVRRDDRWDAIDAMANALENCTGHRPTREDVVTGSALDGLWKRLVVDCCDWLEELIRGDDRSVGF